MSDYNFYKKKNSKSLKEWVKSTDEYFDCTARMLALNIEEGVSVPFQIDRGLYTIYAQVAHDMFSNEYEVTLQLKLDIKIFDITSIVFLPTGCDEVFIIGNTRDIKFENKNIGGMLSCDPVTVFIEPGAFNGLQIRKVPILTTFCDINNTDKEIDTLSIYQNCVLEHMRTFYINERHKELELTKNGNQILSVNRCYITLTVSEILTTDILESLLTKYDCIDCYEVSILHVHKYLDDLKPNEYKDTILKIAHKVDILQVKGIVKLTFIPGVHVRGIKEILTADMQAAYDDWKLIGSTVEVNFYT